MFTYTAVKSVKGSQTTREFNVDRNVPRQKGSEMSVNYEWDIETIDPETDDIFDHNFNDDLSALLPHFVTQNATMRLVLVRHVGNDVEGETDRSWAYVNDNWFLPTEFTTPGSDGQEHPTGIRVPQRFHRLIARAGG